MIGRAPLRRGIAAFGLGLALACLALVSGAAAAPGDARMPELRGGPLDPTNDNGALTLDDGETLELGISTSEIAVKSNFSGAEITIFGAIVDANPFALALDQYDLVVTLEGPKLATTVRRKQRVFGIWINRHSVDFHPIPTSYSLSSTRPLGALATEATLEKYGIGTENLKVAPLQSSADSQVNVAAFREALLRRKESLGLYRSDPKGVNFVSSTLFKASISLPANIPVGTHTVHGYLFRNGNFVAEKRLPLHIVKTGLEQAINTYATNDAFLYGIFAVLLAALTGWLGSVIFRRD
ncbi:TIGR02186 family protein [Pararhizobium mangrovi]|nr:TIGR02186 family protein [Pararhizobium mangrovi]